jgi:hypothetical protein
MKRVLCTAILAACLLPGIATAKSDKPADYLNDKELFLCENDQLTEHLKILYSDPDDRLRVLYVTGASEVSRSAEGLKCKVTLVHTRGRMDGIVEYHTEDGHELYGFKPTPRSSRRR